MSGPRALTGIARAITGELREIARARPDLTTVSAIDIQFSPWNQNSASTKEVWRRLCEHKTRKTNRYCLIKTSVLHDESEPVVNVTFIDGHKLCLHGQYLKYIEMMYYFNTFCKEKESSPTDAPKALF